MAPHFFARPDHQGPPDSGPGRSWDALLTGAGRPSQAKRSQAKIHVRFERVFGTLVVRLEAGAFRPPRRDVLWAHGGGPLDGRRI
jgi:hypothetical protein